MALFESILVILGLALFEVVSSVDNAVINAEVLTKMSPKARKWFLVWGLLIAVIAVRGLLPWLIVWVANPTLGPFEALMSTLSSDPLVVGAVESSAPVLLAGGGIFLIFLFFHWLFLEPKNYGLYGEKFFHQQGVWFYAIVSIILAAVTWVALAVNPLMAFSAVVGSTVFFITHGFKQNAEEKERELLAGNGERGTGSKKVKGAKAGGKVGMSDWSKLLYLEAIDASFSIDSVIGAFAFTLSVPLILLGNGLGAFVVREMTIRNIDSVKKYLYLKNGAMYSILFLGGLMLADAFGAHLPAWLSPVVTFVVIGYFFWKSHRELKRVRESSHYGKIKNSA
ncbi:DUF475 domain-containing protein [Candidatus Micrarchaeota archaeon]|nr:DUF475 domain-containing protein [Candidatus Micrarchaeota archaeon]